uniref:Uncharacterized protein n=1 Tax=Janibacter limosus TaxID=53458 RepID=A0AC61U3S4_9MICO|nr:hypothetical protein [Janibacter limosus]
MTLTHPTNAAHDIVDRAPAHEEHWVDPVTGAHGYPGRAHPRVRHRDGWHPHAGRVHP